MSVCPICQKEYKNNRALNAHMLKAHIEDYRAHDCKIANYYVGMPESFAQSKPSGADQARKPEAALNKLRTVQDVRYLDRSDPAEAAAYAEGYRVLCGEDVYTLEEAEKEGLI